MQTPGLTNRLRQRSRRAGFAVGLSMALTIALLVGSFSWIYAQVDPIIGDFIDTGWEAPPSTARENTLTAADAAAEPTGEPGAAPAERPTVAPTEEPADDPPEEPTPTPEVFQATHISNPSVAVNMRPAPGTGNVPVAVLNGGTPLQYLDEQQAAGDGSVWLKFRTEDGQEGWLLQGTAVAQ